MTNGSILISMMALASAMTLYADRADEIYKHIDKKDYHKADSLINIWETEPGPELYAVKANYHFRRGKKEVLTINRASPKGSERVEIVSKDAKDTFYLFSSYDYDSQEVALAINALNVGLSKYPQRLDLWFGKAHICREIGDYKAQVRTLRNALLYATRHMQEMRWMKDEAIDSIEAFLPATIHQYALEHYREEKMEDFYNIAQLLVEFMPRYPIGYSDIGIYHGEKGRWRKAIGYFQTGLSIDPNDEIILNNIAYAHEMIGDKTQAVRYYRIILNKTKNGELKAYVKERIKGKVAI